MPLYLLPIKLLSDFSCSLKVFHKVLLISYEATLIVITVPSHCQRQPVQFLSCEFSILCESCAYCQQCHCQILQQSVTQNITFFGSEMSFISHYTNCCPKCIFTGTSQLLRLLSGKLLHTCEGTNILLVYWHVLITRDNTDSQNSEDGSITDKLLYVLLAITKVLQIFYHTGKF
jgi:hypothetical protein